jgi:hypothetical protein
MAAATNMGCVGQGEPGTFFLRERERNEEGADLDVLPEISRTAIPVIVAGPLCAVHGDGAGKVKRGERFIR